MKKIVSTLVLLSTLTFSCTNKKAQKSSDESINDSIPNAVIDHHTAKISLDYIGSYKGTLPCADCEGIETSLQLEDENNYVLKTKYLGKKNPSVNERRGTYSWNKEGNTITLSGNENGASQYFVGENYLQQLDLEGNRIEGDLAQKYILQKNVDAAGSTSTNVVKVTETKWKLVELNGKPIKNNSNKEMFIQLDKESRYAAFAGCNNMMGQFELKEDVMRIKFTKGASTMIACLDMTTEQEFAEMLEMVDNYSIHGDNLSFNKARMAPLARFEAMK